MRKTFNWLLGFITLLITVWNLITALAGAGTLAFMVIFNILFAIGYFMTKERKETKIEK